MSIDSSLKTKGNLVKHRNVLSRTERIEYLANRGKFDMDGDDPIGLPKVGNRKVVIGGKTKKGPAAEGEEGAEGATPEGAAPADGS